MLEIDLTKEIEDRLEEFAIRTGRSKSSFIREAILGYLDELEDLCLAEKRLEDVRAGRSRTVPLEDVMREYGLEN